MMKRNHALRSPKQDIGRYCATCVVFLLCIFIVDQCHHGVDAAAFVLRKTIVVTTASTSPLSASTTTDDDESTSKKRLVLVGGGHAHLQVIKALNYKSRPKDLHVTLIDQQSSASYSGMVPGCISGLYSPQETLIQLKPLADWAKIDFIQDEVVDVDLERQCISLRQQHITNVTTDPIPFDCLSLDIGSTTLGLDQIPGVRDYAIPTRPISKLIQKIEQSEVELLQQQNDHDDENQEQVDGGKERRVKVVIVGGGPAGIELSMSFLGRWQPLVGQDNISVTLLEAAPQLLANESPACRAALSKVLTDQGIHVLCNTQVKEITKDRIYLNDGQQQQRQQDSLPYTHCIWSTGAASHRLAETLRQRGLAVNDRGWIQVSNTLQSISHAHVFAAGDCSSIEGLPKGPPPKAGVYAVRAGPILVENLITFLSNQQPSRPLTVYQPQDDFLKLIGCGDGTALGFRFGIPVYGKWVWELKDRIDRNFMALFQPENLPNLEDNAPIDTSQYDARREKRQSPLPVLEAAELLQQSDDDHVDYTEAWDVIRDMAEDDEYKAQVVKYIEERRIALPPQQVKETIG